VLFPGAGAVSENENRTLGIRSGVLAHTLILSRSGRSVCGPFPEGCNH
jgi:hypothetical protein